MYNNNKKQQQFKKHTYLYESLNITVFNSIKCNQSTEIFVRIQMFEN